MEEHLLVSIKEQLTERREKLQEVVERFPEEESITRLLEDVDAALERIENKTYGLCEVCHDPIETERLLIDPLMTVCLGDLTKEQQQALESDLEYAGKIQRALLPQKEIKTDEWEFAHHYLPLSTVGGDFCNFIPLDDNSLFFMLGDVSGKGISASIMMSNLYALIKTLLSFNLPIDQIMLKANRLFCESTLSPNYATMILGKAFTDGTIELCIAGHNPPLFVKNGDIISIGATGIPVGMFCSAEYSVERIQLKKDEFLFLYTDGLTEASVRGVEFGEKRVKEKLRESKILNSNEIITGILHEQKKFLDTEKPGDDILVATIKKS